MTKSLSSNESKYLTRNPLKKYFINRFTKRILKLIAQKDFDNLLDVGCGEGFVDELIFRKNPKLKITGVDISNVILKKAKVRNPKIKYLQAALPKLPFPNRSFDLVICLEVLEHLSNYRDAVKELLRVTDKVLIISVPHEPWFSLLRFLAGHNILQFGKHPQHINFWDRKSFTKFLKRYSPRFKVETCGPWLIGLMVR